MELAENLPKLETVYKAGGGTLTWTPELNADGVALSGTVTLHNAAITAEKGGIILPVPFTLVLQGDNVITTLQGEPITPYGTECAVSSHLTSLTITGPGSLTINSAGRAIRAYGDLTIQGGATVTVQTTGGDFAIYSGNIKTETINIERGNITIKDSTLFLTANSDNAPLFANMGNLSIENSHVYVKSAKTGTQYGVSAIHGEPVYMKDSDVAAIGSSSQAGVGVIYFGGSENDFVMDGGILYVENTSSGGYDFDYCDPYAAAINNAVICYQGTVNYMIQNGDNIQYANCTYDETAHKVTQVGYGYIRGNLTYGEDIPVPPNSNVYLRIYGLNPDHTAWVNTPAALTIPAGVTAEIPAIQVSLPESKLINNGTLTSTIGISNFGTIEGGGTLNASVLTRQTVDASNNKDTFTAHGDATYHASFTKIGTTVSNNVTTQSIINIPGGASLTIPMGATLDATANGTITAGTLENYYTNNGTVINRGTILLPTAREDTPDFGNITNDGTIVLCVEDAASDEEISAMIERMDLTGSGKVEVRRGGTTIATYTNRGDRLLLPAGILDFHDPDNLPSDGAARSYHWDAGTNTLTLADGFSAEKVILPDAAVTIVTEGAGRIDELAIYGDPQNTNLTFSGTGTLTIPGHIEISGGRDNSLTVDEGAKVVAGNGITIGASGGVDGVVTVKGTLTAAQGDGISALYAGKVVVKSGGTLNVSGETGVSLSGMSGSGGRVYTGAFTLEENGTVNANCENVVICVNAGVESGFTPPVKPDEVIRIPAGYLPEGYVPKLTDDNHSAFISGGKITISKDNVPSIPDPPDVPSTPIVNFYTVKVEDASHGEVTANRRTALRGDTVTVTASADSGYALHALTVTDSLGNELALTDKGGGKYTFTMPGRSVTIKATFAPQTCDGGADCPCRAFSDLDISQWYHEAADYVLRNKLMEGDQNGLFRPNDTLTRAQLAQILYNRAGRPAVTGGSAFTDVSSNAWYASAVTWAAERGIVDGCGDGTFRPNDNITREQLAVMLWRYAGSPAAEKRLRFTDADQASGYALDALRWAAESGVMSGYGDGRLKPKGLATRAQAAQMLKNLLETENLL